MVSEVRAELVAQVSEVLVVPGDRVVGGAAVAVLESMKMEIPVVVAAAGTVQGVHVAVGDVVQEGDLIVELA